MTFWTNARLRDALSSGVVSPYNPVHVHQAAYELGVAEDYAISAIDGEARRKAAPGDDIVIPPGQFALLLTQEVISIPSNALGFISVKAGWKLKGLVNVSGFHVDPGYCGRLRFAVYNASGQTLRMTPGRRLFQLWLSQLEEALVDDDRYRNSNSPDAGIQDSEVTAIEGMVPSPAGLSARISGLEERMTAELLRLETAQTKKVDDSTHVAALNLAQETNKISERLESVRATQKLQWVFLCVLLAAVVTQPLIQCHRSDGTAKVSSATKN